MNEASDRKILWLFVSGPCDLAPCCYLPIIWSIALSDPLQA